MQRLKKRRRSYGHLRVVPRRGISRSDGRTPAIPPSHDLARISGPGDVVAVEILQDEGDHVVLRLWFRDGEHEIETWSRAVAALFWMRHTLWEQRGHGSNVDR